MKITIEQPTTAVGMREVKQGNFFRFANGKKTDVIYIALEQQTIKYDTFWICRDLSNNTLAKLSVNTRKERAVVIVEPLEIVVRDQNGSPDYALVLDSETDLVPEAPQE